MKYLVLLLVVGLALWWIRSTRTGVGDAAARKPGTAGKAQDMACCPVCGLHLPSAEAVPGKIALYCCAAHRDAAER